MLKKIGVFTRIKKSVFKFEEYEEFIEEPLKKAFGYFFKLIVIFSLFVTIALIYVLNLNLKNIKTAVETEFPNFKIESNILNIEEKETFEYYFEDYNFQLIMNETTNSYVENDYNNCLIMLKDKLIVKYSGITQQIGYNYIGPISNKFFETKEWDLIYCNICLSTLIGNFIVYSIFILLDIVTLSIIGLIINTLIRTKFKYNDLVKISIYASTLPSILFLLYRIANILFGTTIEFFDLAYSAISYIYLITVMLMIKADVIKNMQELQNVLEEQKKVKEELKRQAEEEQEKQRQKDKEKEDEKKERKQKEKGKQSREPQTDNG